MDVNSFPQLPLNSLLLIYCLYICLNPKAIYLFHQGNKFCRYPVYYKKQNYFFSFPLKLIVLGFEKILDLGNKSFTDFLYLSWFYGLLSVPFSFSLLSPILSYQQSSRKSEGGDGTLWGEKWDERHLMRWGEYESLKDWPLHKKRLLVKYQW